MSQELSNKKAFSYIVPKDQNLYYTGCPNKFWTGIQQKILNDKKGEKFVKMYLHSISLQFGEFFKKI